MKRLVTLSVMALVLPLAVAAQETGGTLHIEQRTVNEMYGKWTLIKPGNERVIFQRDEHTFQQLPAGSYTLLVTPPNGAIAQVEKFLDDDRIETKNHPQISFVLEEGMNVSLRISYQFTRVGTVSVSSNPPGLPFTVVGPNDFEAEGVTPTSYDRMPEGQYSVTYLEIKDCSTPPPISKKLMKDSRINFTITLACDGLEHLEQSKQQDMTFKYVNTVIDGETVIFHDTSIDTWYAPHVHTAVKTGVMSGYRDERGKLSGEFGPGNNVTLAELLKIAHELADVDEEAAHGQPQNPAGRGTWFESYLVSAEQRNWLVYRDHQANLGRNATRAEVVATFMQALDVPRNWPKGDLFHDVQRTTSYAASIETAAEHGLAGGYDDESFRPHNPINRAEIAKIISKAIDLYLDEEATTSDQ